MCGDADVCPHDGENDPDSDSVCSDEDVCPFDGENDLDGDGLCGDVDACPLDKRNDLDGDGICGDVDSCPFDAENDADADGLCAGEDKCPYDPENDIDDDDICGDVDSINDNEFQDQSNSAAQAAAEAEEERQFIGMLVGIILAILVIIVVIIVVCIVARRLGAHKPNHYYEYRCIHDVSYYSKPSFKHPLLSVPQATKKETFLPARVEKHDGIEWLEITKDHWLPTRSAGKQPKDCVFYFEKVLKRTSGRRTADGVSPRKNQVLPISQSPTDEMSMVRDPQTGHTPVMSPIAPKLRKDRNVSKSFADLGDHAAVSAALVMNDSILKAMYEADASRASMHVNTGNNSKTSGQAGAEGAAALTAADARASRSPDTRRRRRKRVAALTAAHKSAGADSSVAQSSKHCLLYTSPSPRDRG